VRVKNTKNILVKNIMDGCVGALGFWLVGYAFAIGDGNLFIGTDHWFLAGKFNEVDERVSNIPYNGSKLAFWFFQYAFAATAATIVSGAVAERIKFSTYMTYTLWITSFMYPCVVHWAWSSTGWASAFRTDGPLLFDVGVLDFAGCGVVHMVGGACSFVACIFTGPRIGRFDEKGRPCDIPQQSAPLQLLGMFILWFGWYGFNCFSVLRVTDGRASIVAKIAVNTTVSAASAAVTCILLGKLRTKIVSVEIAINGVLAGLVSVTSACATIHAWAAVVTGVVGALVYSSVSALMLRLHVDDVVDACAVHFACGVWGLLTAALFTTKEYFAIVYFESEHYGLFYGGGAKILAANVVFIFAVIGWVIVNICPIFIILKKLFGVRVSPEIEMMGMDISKHGGMTYPELVLMSPPGSKVHVQPAGEK